MHSPERERFRIAFIGGTGPEGRGLALRLAILGHSIVIGSRSRERAEEAARELQALVPLADAQGLPNLEAAAIADMVLLTFPYGGVRDMLPSLAAATREKIVVSTIAPVVFHEGRPALLHVEAGSAAQEVQQLLPEARVVSAFQTIDAHQLQNLTAGLDTDVVVCSDDAEARRMILRLAGELPGVRGLSGGRLSSSQYMEACTALLVIVNRIYKVHSGFRLTGVDR